MRPERLELEGFTAFRGRVDIDFSDADLFVLVGPTGSGKSSIIDAITFALYGSIPRLKRGRVEPVISLGAERARIRFEFTVGGVRYTAIRVVQRTKTGATTNEARLEGGPEDVIGASELSAAVERLLGLSYEHFTKSVVLPQGKFASFLLDGSSDRQALLRELLDLGRYAKVRDLAVQRANSSEARAEALRDSLARLASVTPEAVAELQGRIEQLTEVTEWAAGERTMLSEKVAEREEAQREVTRLAQLVEALRGISPPDGLDELDAEMLTASEERDLATQQLASASRALEDATERTLAAGDPAEIARLTGLVEQAETLDGRIAEGVTKTAELEAELTQAVGESEKLAAEWGHATARLQAIRNDHAAHILRSAAAPGEPCPVCRRTLDAEHLGDDTIDSASLAEAERAATSAAESADTAKQRVVSLQTQLEHFRSQLAKLQTEQAAVAERLAGRTRAQLEEQEKKVAAARTGHATATRALSAARVALDEAEKQVASISERASAFWTTLDKQRMTVTALDPPSIDRKDVGSEWAAFLDWRDSRLEAVAAEAEQAQANLARQTAAIETLTAEMADRIASAGVELMRGADPYELALVERARTGERLERMQQDLEVKVKSAAAVEGYETDAVVAQSLANHLKVNGFERWLIEEVIHDLVLHANERLETLTNGAYALAVEKSEFVIIDRLNADERRAPETLSGGETFVVSLALALSLADQMAAISMSGTARLESVFLDEGFGTLDSETLDTVASVIHELGADGRTVGLITHVSELAQQIPVRFEVSKQAGSARVERVEA